VAASEGMLKSHSIAMIAITSPISSGLHVVSRSRVERPLRVVHTGHVIIHVQMRRGYKSQEKSALQENAPVGDDDDITPGDVAASFIAILVTCLGQVDCCPSPRCSQTLAQTTSCTSPPDISSGQRQIPPSDWLKRSKQNLVSTGLLQNKNSTCASIPAYQLYLPSSLLPPQHTKRVAQGGQLISRKKASIPTGV
jgi:hypothetical protein